MDAIEKAIRSAFAKGDPRERAFREKVYRSAFAALEKAIAANPGMAPEMADLRRRHLTARISDIESEFLPAVPAVGQPASSASPQPPAVEAPADSEPDPRYPQPELEPETEPERDGFAAEPHVPERHDFDYEVDTPDVEYRKPPRRGRPWVAVFVGVLLVCAVGIGIWWLVGSGVFRAPGEGDGSVPNPPQTVEEEDFDPDRPAEPPLLSGGGDLEDWIAVFDPSDPTTVTAPGDSSAETMDADGEPFIRIGAGASGSPVLFDVGQGVLEELAGRRVVFNVVAERPEDGETQIAVDCNLAELGDCGRKRYVVGVTREELLFEVDLPNTDPGAGGTIAINPDVEGAGKTVDIYAIRVSPAQ